MECAGEASFTVPINTAVQFGPGGGPDTLGRGVDESTEPVLESAASPNDLGGDPHASQSFSPREFQCHRRGFQFPLP